MANSIAGVVDDAILVFGFYRDNMTSIQTHRKIIS